MSFSDSPRIGWYGLGSMGLPMACNLQQYLSHKNMPALHYANRTMSRGDALKALGGITCQNIAELVQACDIIFISVSDDAALTSVISQFISTPTLHNKILVDTTTVHPSTTASLSPKLAICGCFYIAAPVFGAPPAARAAQILIAVAGSDVAIARVKPYLKDVIARGVIHFSLDPAHALLLKTTSNFITAGMMYLLSEAHVLAEKAELPVPVLEALIEQNFGAYALGVSKRISSGSYLPAAGELPNSALELAIKDVGHGLDVARENGMRLEVGELSMAAMEEARGYGAETGRRLDSSSVYGFVRRRAGLRFESKVVRERDGDEDKDKDKDKDGDCYEV